MTFPDYPEGRLTRLRSKVVCEEVLYDIAIKLKLGDRLVLGKGEEATGGRTRKSILADAVEALIAAVYLDSGFDQVKEVFLWMFQDYIGMAEKGRLNLDFKTRLQEIVQKENSEHRIRYNVYKEEGPDHDKKFYVKAYLDKKVIGKGVGKTKKASEQEAAKSALINRGSISEF
jgi:ribonuclease-3